MQRAVKAAKLSITTAIRCAQVSLWRPSKELITRCNSAARRNHRLGHPQPRGHVVGMGALLDLADRPEAQLLRGLVIQLAAVVVAHAPTRPDPHHKSTYLWTA